MATRKYHDDALREHRKSIKSQLKKGRNTTLALMVQALRRHLRREGQEMLSRNAFAFMLSNVRAPGQRESGLELDDTTVMRWERGEIFPHPWRLAQLERLARKHKRLDLAEYFANADVEESNSWKQTLLGDQGRRLLALFEIVLLNLPNEVLVESDLFDVEDYRAMIGSLARIIDSMKRYQNRQRPARPDDPCLWSATVLTRDQAEAWILELAQDGQAYYGPHAPILARHEIPDEDGGTIELLRMPKVGDWWQRDTRSLPGEKPDERKKSTIEDNEADGRTKS